MDIQGRRIHIAGSASQSVDPRLLDYGHDLIRYVTQMLCAMGAVFLVQVGGEPRIDQQQGRLPMIFDWTVIDAVNDCLDSGRATSSSWRGPVLATIATSKTERQIPKDRRNMWEQLLTQNAVQVEYLAPGWSSGAVRRNRMAELGDILVVLSGGEGAEHLANEYSMRGKPVLPFDLDLGSGSGDGAGGAARLAGQMKAHPERFAQFTKGSVVGSLITRMATQGGRVPAKNVSEAVVDIMKAIEPPTAFYVRLLDPENEAFRATDRFFRNVVDPVVGEAGYRFLEMGLSPVTQPWMNVEIFNALHDSRLAVVDLTGLRPNCLVELGYALGRATRTLITAQKNTRLPFDASMLECYFWDDAVADDIRACELKEYWCRNINHPPIVERRGIL